MITCVLFPQPLLPNIKLAVNEVEEKLMLTQNCFEATNLARMHMGATCHKMECFVKSEAYLICMETVDCLHTFNPTIKSAPSLTTSDPIKIRSCQ